MPARTACLVAAAPRRQRATTAAARPHVHRRHRRRRHPLPPQQRRVRQEVPAGDDGLGRARSSTSTATAGRTSSSSTRCTGRAGPAPPSLPGALPQQPQRHVHRRDARRRAWRRDVRPGRRRRRLRQRRQDRPLRHRRSAATACSGTSAAASSPTSPPRPASATPGFSTSAVVVRLRQATASSICSSPTTSSGRSTRTCSARSTARRKSYCTPESYKGQSPTLYRNKRRRHVRGRDAEGRPLRPAREGARASRCSTTTTTAGSICSSPTTRSRTGSTATSGNGTFTDVGVAGGRRLQRSGRGARRHGRRRRRLRRLRPAEPGHRQLLERDDGALPQRRQRPLHRRGADVDDRPGVAADADLRLLLLRLRPRRPARHLRRQRPRRRRHQHACSRSVTLRAAAAPVPQPRRQEVRGRDGARRRRASRSRSSARGAAYGDFDSDGDLDLLVTTNNGPARLLRNDGGERNHRLRVTLVGHDVEPRRHRRARPRARPTAARSPGRWSRPARATARRASCRSPSAWAPRPGSTRIEVTWPNGKTETARRRRGEPVAHDRGRQGRRAKTPFAASRPRLAMTADRARSPCCGARRCCRGPAAPGRRRSSAGAAQPRHRRSREPPTAPTTSASRCSSSSTTTTRRDGVPRGAGDRPGAGHRARSTSPSRCSTAASPEARASERERARPRAARSAAAALRPRADRHARDNRADDAVAAFERVLRARSDGRRRARSTSARSSSRSGATTRRIDAAAAGASRRAVQRHRRLQPRPALSAAARADEGRAAMDALPDSCATSGYGVTYSQTYLEQGRYAEALASTGRRARARRSDATPAVTFADATARCPCRDRRPPPDAGRQRDAGRSRRRRRPRPRRRRAPSGLALLPQRRAAASPTHAASRLGAARAGDRRGRRRLRQRRRRRSVRAAARRASRCCGRKRTGGSSTRRAAAGSPRRRRCRVATAAFARRRSRRRPRSARRRRRPPRTGCCGTTATARSPTSPPRPGSAARRPIGRRRRRPTSTTGATSTCWSLRPPAPPALFRNMRDGTFRDVARDVGLACDGAAYAWRPPATSTRTASPTSSSAARGGAGARAERRHAAASSSPPPTGDTPARSRRSSSTTTTTACSICVALRRAALRMFRNLGSALGRTSRARRGARQRAGACDASAVATGDRRRRRRHRSSLVPHAGRHPRPGGTTAATATRSLRVRLTGRVSNRSGVGAKVELRAGSLRQRLETSSATPAPRRRRDVVFGLGVAHGRRRVRVLWPSGSSRPRAAAVDAAAAPLRRRCHDRGARSQAVVLPVPLHLERHALRVRHRLHGRRRDGLLGGARRGNTPDPDEYVRIRGDQLRPRDGRYELRVTNELEEALFVDRLQLVAVDHPRGRRGLSERRAAAAPRTRSASSTARAMRPLAAAIDEHGHDVLDRLARDRSPVSRTTSRWSRIRGYAAEHA